jgi:hypothetical protein
MSELVIVVAPLLLLGGIALLAHYVPLSLLAGASFALVALGTVFGVPSGIYYHVVLRRELLRLGPLPARWLWHPQRHHEQLAPAAYRRVRLWFVLGGLGFLVIVSGALLGILALALWFRAGRASG